MEQTMTITPDKYAVIYKGNAQYFINKNLLANNKCVENLQAIIDTHLFKLIIIDMIEESTNEKEMKELAKDVMECERELQRLWKFDTIEDRFIKFWLLPRCECPYYDTEDKYPYGEYYIRSSCPPHGG
jgi:hypothetical protein